MRKLCQWKGVEIIEGEVCPDHIHIMVSIPPKMSVSNREFWCKGYYVDTAGKNTKGIKAYIANQLKQDRENNQLSIFDSRDPFTGN